eukprot:TRINITY_DN2931_c0_g1_i1.p1 TRINITY_DN2931_c0_g1~~TRINITY_DN2931_c0_g1_i1.p1  ORF type:complete len:189 (-),score=10.76 TRINITY_DN2931_c0_g1_i1:401-967(-)
MNGKCRSVSFSERLLSNRYSHQVSSDEDFNDLYEEDVWPLPCEDFDDSPPAKPFSLIVHRTGIRHPGAPPTNLSQVFSTTPLRVPPQQNLVSPPQNYNQRPRSAPVNVPDWQKMLRFEAPKLRLDDPNDSWSDEEDDERLPPHEILAREHTRSETRTKSMLQGIGRTLKGRDLSRVRNTVWRHTGFPG